MNYIIVFLKWTIMQEFLENVSAVSEPELMLLRAA
jgi:hypothetical protein